MRPWILLLLVACGTETTGTDCPDGFAEAGDGSCEAAEETAVTGDGKGGGFDAPTTPPTDTTYPTGAYEGDEAGECSDGADNDRDGLFDYDDPGCFGSPDCEGATTTAPGTTVDTTDCDYIGGWPCNPQADDLADPGFGGPFAVGSMIPRAHYEDQYADVVDLYDLLGGGVPLFVQVSATWSPPDTALFNWLTGGDDPGYCPGLSIADAIVSGQIGYVVILDEDDDRNAPNSADAEAFHARWSGGGVDIPVLADPAHSFIEWIDLTFFPSGFAVNADGTVAYIGDLFYCNTLEWLEAGL